MHGGFDSFIEEFYSWMRYFADHDYEVIAFEGPGQGAARRKFGLALDYEWEKPTKAVLDYFKLDDVTLIGISMGGWFCFRAAAFEPRIKRVVASSIAYDYVCRPLHVGITRFIKNRLSGNVEIIVYLAIWFKIHRSSNLFCFMDVRNPARNALDILRGTPELKHAIFFKQQLKYEGI